MLLMQVSASAQFFQGWGLMGGITYSNQKWKYSGEFPNEKLKYVLRFNGELFAEFGKNDHFRWVTELQYTQKGARRDLPDGTRQRFANDYAAWNNYLMVRREFLWVIPYVKVGPRLEYLVSSNQVPAFKTFHPTGSVGIGVEFVAYSRVKFLTEFHYVPDLSYSFESDLVKIRQPAFELRIGIKFGKKGTTTCPGLK